MEHIREFVGKANSFGEYYKHNVYNHLKDITNQIISEFKKTFENHARSSGLVISNSVYSNIYLYEFTDRVKDPISLVEKLKNKNLIFELAQSYDLTNLGEDEKSSLNKFFYKVDDIIGIKILTSLNEDCKNVLQLIKQEMSDSLNGIELVLDGEIPTTMSNGRKIYKLKGCYKDTYSFELQIKSKIDSAWGDLEHNLFYKDYDFNYIKNNNREIMVNIGSLLEKTDKLMFSIRNGKQEFSNEYKRYAFFQAISEGFEKFVLENYSSKYILEKNMDTLYDLYNYCVGTESENYKVKYENIKVPINLTLESNLINNFNLLKMNNFEITLLEAIHFNWLQEETQEEHNKQIERVEKLINGLLYHSLNKVSNKLQMQLITEQYTNKIINIITEYKFDFFKKNLLLNTELLAQFVMLFISINEAAETARDEDFSEYEDLEYENVDQFIDQLILIIFKQIFVENVDINEEKDTRIFITEMVKVLNKHNSSKRENNEVIQETINLLNKILGGNYE
ncbi:hypothetical protein [Neobacillus mesonae]|uniref:hypothetical protein n=1 Tax=Neobacillus mesonae TaxID=1193713 RepID=UPI002573A521|nr:hypothetical protein [Neobacillus mesonae]